MQMQMSSMGSMSMSMTSINWQTKCVVFLFQTFHAKNLLQFAVGCITIFLISIFSQMLGLPMFKDFIIGATYTKNKLHNSSNHFELENGTESERVQNGGGKQTKIDKFGSILFVTKLRMTVFHSTNALLNLLLMLIAMSMNGYVILSMALGLGVGKTVCALIVTNKQLSASNGQDKQLISGNCCQM